VEIGVEGLLLPEVLTDRPEADRAE
jgi:hypothetical protein